jgi:hypothetical protein
MLETLTILVLQTLDFQGTLLYNYNKSNKYNRRVATMHPTARDINKISSTITSLDAMSRRFDDAVRYNELMKYKLALQRLQATLIDFQAETVPDGVTPVDINAMRQLVAASATSCQPVLEAVDARLRDQPTEATRILLTTAHSVVEAQL